MRWTMLPAMIACAFVLLVSAPMPASAISTGLVGHAVTMGAPGEGIVQKVTRRWRDRWDYYPDYYYYDERPYPRYYDDRYVVYYPPYYYGRPYRYYRPPYPYYRTYFYERRVYRRPGARIYWRD